MAPLIFYAYMFLRGSMKFLSLMVLLAKCSNFVAVHPWLNGGLKHKKIRSSFVLRYTSGCQLSKAYAINSCGGSEMRHDKKTTIRRV